MNNVARLSQALNSGDVVGNDTIGFHIVVSHHPARIGPQLALGMLQVSIACVKHQSDQRKTRLGQFDIAFVPERKKTFVNSFVQIADPLGVSLAGVVHQQKVVCLVHQKIVR